MRGFFLAATLTLVGCGGGELRPVQNPPVTPGVPQPTPVPPSEDCKEGFTTGYQQVATVISAKCQTCHPGFNSYSVMRSKIDEALRRVSLGANDPRRMPPPPNTEISPVEKTVLQKWKAEGFQEQSRCKDKGLGQSSNLDASYLRSHLLADLQRQDPEARLQARYLVAMHYYNETLGQYQESLIETAVNKGVNSVSRIETIRKLAPIDEKHTLYRVDLTAFGLLAEDWKFIVEKEPYKVIDNSTEGVLIQQLTGTAQPWLHADNFLNTMLSPVVYNRIMRIPPNAKDLYKALGVDRDAQHRARTVRYLGFTGSPIANNNRRLRRYDTAVNDPGFLWISNDVDNADLPKIRAANVFQFPFSLETGGVAVYQYRAEEWIFELKNGLLGFALYDFPGQVRQEKAPVTVVHQNGPFDSEISVGRDCMRCHQKLIPAVDQVRLAALESGDFKAADISRIRDFYQGPDVNVALFARDNRSYSEALAKVDIAQEGDEPINKVTDHHRSNFDLYKMAAFFFLTPEEFLEKLGDSNDSRSKIPQLLSGGRITFDQSIQATPDILREFEIFVDRK